MSRERDLGRDALALAALVLSVVLMGLCVGLVALR